MFMRALDYIQSLKDLVALHGALECVDAEDDAMSPPEEVEGVFVLAERG